MLLNQEITLDATSEAIDYLTSKGYQPEYGARPVKRVIQKEVLNQLSKEMLAGKINADSIVVNAFRPYSGTKLRKICIDKGLIPKESLAKVKVSSNLS